MKTMISILKITAVLFFFGFLFFSCEIEKDDENGTLVINLPGNGNSRAISPGYFSDNLRYKIECTGSTGKISLPVNKGPVSLSLAAGIWKVEVIVYNVNEPEFSLGSQAKTVPVMSGQVVPVTMNITIEKTQRKITGVNPPFTITTINHEAGTAQIIVPYDTYVQLYNGEDVRIEFRHTGAVIKDFSQGKEWLFSDDLTGRTPVVPPARPPDTYNGDFGVSVVSQDGTSKTYTFTYTYPDES